MSKLEKGTLREHGPKPTKPPIITGDTLTGLGWDWADMFPNGEHPGVRSGNFKKGRTRPPSSHSNVKNQYAYERLSNREWLETELKTKRQKRIAGELGCHISGVSQWKIRHGL